MINIHAYINDVFFFSSLWSLGAYRPRETDDQKLISSHHYHWAIKKSEISMSPRIHALGSTPKKTTDSTHKMNDNPLLEKSMALDP